MRPIYSGLINDTGPINNMYGINMTPIYSLYKLAGLCVLVLLLSACSSGDGTPGPIELSLRVTAVGVNK